MNFEKLIKAKQGSNNYENDNDIIGVINNNTNEPKQPIESINRETSIIKQQPDTEINEIDNNTELGNNNEQPMYADLDLNTKRVKLYLDLLDNNHHYFINYNDCYNKGQSLLNLLETNNSQELKNNIKMKLTKYKKRGLKPSFNILNVNLLRIAEWCGIRDSNSDHLLGRQIY